MFPYRIAIALRRDIYISRKTARGLYTCYIFSDVHIRFHRSRRFFSPRLYKHGTMSCLKEAYGSCSAPKQVASTCPPRMSDGRSFTSYRQHCHFQAMANAGAGRPLNSNQLRKFFTQNAEKIMEDNRAAASQTMGCKTCFDLDCSGTMLPEKMMQVQTKRTVSFPVAEPMGLGMGRSGKFEA